jgi:hypothetical protein
MQPKLLEKYNLFPVCLLILALAFLSGFEPVLHNHDLDESHHDCASCTWFGNHAIESNSNIIIKVIPTPQEIWVKHTPTDFKFFYSSNSSRAPPFFR